jgi:hypothetical protein
MPIPQSGQREHPLALSPQKAQIQVISYPWATKRPKGIGTISLHLVYMDGEGGKRLFCLKWLDVEAYALLIAQGFPSFSSLKHITKVCPSCLL